MPRAMPMEGTDSTMWTDEEKRYLRAILRHDFTETPATEELRRALHARRMNGGGGPTSPKNHIRNNDSKPPVGEFRVLVIGAKGVGKTSILTRICKGRLPMPEEPYDPLYEQGCRQVTEIDGQNYTIDALEMPSKHLWRDDLVQQAINITEAAIVVYDVTDPDSLRLARGLHELIRDTIAGGPALAGPSNPLAEQQQHMGAAPGFQAGGAANGVPSGSGAREYALLLVGNKSDAGDDARRIAYSDGSKVAASWHVKTSFMEVSATTGNQITLLFPKIGKEILTLRSINQQRKEFAEKMERMRAEAHEVQVRRKQGGLWRRLSRSFFTRREVAQI